MELQTADNLLPDLILKGDLGKLTEEQQVQYYASMCERIGLDPLAKPFELIRLSGKLTLYCGRSGAAQLNRKHRISHELVDKKITQGICCVTAKAISHDGRYTTSTGAVNVHGLKGDALANAMMKAETKAKRRATLDLVGLGMLDESEIETIKNAEIIQPVIEHKPEMITEKNHRHLEAKISELGLDRDRVKAFARSGAISDS